ncbi:MAG: hypothetical protein V1747_07735 [Candidatus Omnitrophota bacterium]
MSVSFNEELKQSKVQEVVGLPINKEIIFSNHKNVYKKRIEKRQSRLLKKIAFLKPFLSGDENIIMITTACSPMSITEQFLVGWMIFYLKRSLLVFTNKRIFHIPTKTDYSYRNSIAQIFYEDCQTITVRSRSLICKYKNNIKEQFHYIESSCIKKIKSLIKDLTGTGENASKYHRRTHICPRCAHELEQNKYMCLNCQLVFLNKKDSDKISWIYPGGGYFYTRHPFLGLGDAIVQLILIIWVVDALVTVITKGVETIGILVFSTILLVFEKLMTVYEATHFISEYIPIEKNLGK